MSGISTYGYDMVYAMRFPEANRQLQVAFDTYQQQQAALRRQLAQELGGGYRAADADAPNLVVMLSSRGRAYTQVPTVRLVAPENGLPANTRAHARLRLQQVLRPKTTAYATPPTISLRLPAGATCEHDAEVKAVFGGVGHIEVTNAGSDYDAPPAVSLSGGGGGSGATAEAVLVGGKVVEIRLTSPGSGYTSAPSVTIAASGFGTTAAATAFLGLTLEVSKPGAGYTAVPEVLLNGEADVAQVLMEVDEVVFARVDATQPHDSFAFPPALVFSAPAGAGAGAQAFSLLALEHPEKWHKGTGPGDRDFTLSLFQNAALSWRLDYLKAGLDSEMDNQLSSAFTRYVSAGVTLAECLEGLAAVVFTRFIDHADKYPYEHELSLLLKAKRAEVDPYSEWLPTYPAEASVILKRHGQATWDKAIAFLRQEEKTQSGLRVKRALRTVDASLVFDYTQDPGLGGAPQPGYLRALPVKPAYSPAFAHALIATVIEVFVALLPEQQSAQLVALGQQFTSAPAQLFQKVNLRLGAWQLATGGNEDWLQLKIPIRGGLLYLGEEAVALAPRHGYVIRIRLKLAWLHRARVAHLEVKSKDHSYIEVLGIGPDDDDVAAANPLPLSDDFADSLEWCVKNTLNAQLYLANQPVGPHLLTPVDYSFVYNHTLASLDLYETLADDDPQFAWMYPTSASYAVKDEFSNAPDIARSILGICCMSENRTNHGVPTVDINAVPPTADTAILISPDLVLRKFVLPEFIKLFQHPLPATTPASTPATTPASTPASTPATTPASTPATTPATDKPVAADAQPADFQPKNVVEGSSSRQLSYVNSIDLTTQSLHLLPADETPATRPTTAEAETAATAASLVGVVRAGKATVSIENSFIKLAINDIEYDYPLTKDGETTPVKIDNEMELRFVLRQEHDVRQLQFSTNSVKFSFHPDYLKNDNPFGDYARDIALGVGVSLATNIVFVIGSFVVPWAVNGTVLLARRAYGGARWLGRVVTKKMVTDRIADASRLRGSRIDLHSTSAPAPLRERTTAVIEQINESHQGLVVQDLTISESNPHVATVDATLNVSELGNAPIPTRLRLDRNAAHDPLISLSIPNEPQQAGAQAGAQAVRRAIRRNSAPTRTDSLAFELATFDQAGPLRPGALGPSSAAALAQVGQLPVQPTRTSWGQLFRRAGRALWGRGQALYSISTPIGGLIGGALLLFLKGENDKRYEAYKSNISRGLDNSSGNGTLFLAQTLLRHLNWPAFKDVGLEVSHFYLLDSLVIGLAALQHGRRLDDGAGAHLAGYASPYNPQVLLASLGAGTRHLEVVNTGYNPLELVFVLNQQPYQGHLGLERGAAVTVPAQTRQLVPLSDFQLNSFADLALLARAEEDMTTYTLTLHEARP